MKRVVGIFSREAPSSFRFLSDFLKGEDCVTEVRSFSITNNGYQRLQEEASRCHFAILYHSKDRGRVNITDVTDSLYDEELRYLSQTLGKKNVLVVADDLDISSPELKMRILGSQPLIDEMAADFYLFSKTDKNSRNLLNEKLQKISSHIQRKDSNSNELMRSVLVVAGFVPSSWSLAIQCVMVVVGFVQFSCSIPIQCVMVVVGFVQSSCAMVIQCVMVVVGFVQSSCAMVIQCVMVVVGFIQSSWSLAIQCVMVVVGFVQFSCSIPIECVMKAWDLCSSSTMRQSTMSR
ncbi:uncharacterized protein [Eleutherodactylus coqui]|uniref:uncharacterized protein n=1 Tax=Eleutherodactylus coqui TaxID=57060 RepID=UPI003462FC03